MSVRIRTEEVLYERGQIKVVYESKPDTHYDLVVRGSVIPLTRGQLGLLATSSSQEDFHNKVISIDRSYNRMMLDTPHTESDIELALAKALIKELTHESVEAHFERD